MKKRKERLYITGPMTGYPELNYPAFERAAKELRAKGYFIVSPAEVNKKITGVKYGKNYYAALRRDIIAMLGQCTHLATLPKVNKSNGGRREKTVAKLFYMPIHTVKYWLEKQ